jgi:tetratricopeptide (TPR) repeat protein
VFVPSFLVLLVRDLADRETRRRAAIDVAIGVVLTVAAGWVLSRLEAGYDLLGTLLEVSRMALLNEEENQPGYLLSALHLRNFLNEQLLIGPLGLFLFLPGLGVAVWAWWRGRAGRVRSTGDATVGPLPALMFLALAGLAYAAASWLAGESNLGYPRNWDLLAPASLAFTAAGLGLFIGSGLKLRSALPVMACAVVLSLYHTVPWVGVNTSFERGFARLKTLPSTGGETETNVARWYLLQDDEGAARAWLSRALRANPRNNNAQYLLGTVLMKEGKFAEAAVRFRAAVQERKYKIEYRRALVNALLGAGEFAAAATACEELLARAPDDLATRTRYGIALARSGREEEALAVFAGLRQQTDATAAATTSAMVGRFLRQLGDAHMAAQRWSQAIAVYREAMAWSDDIADVALNLGYALVQTERPGEAIEVWQRGLRSDPRSLRLLVNLAELLYSAGRTEEAQSYARRALQLNPAPETAQRLRELLAGDR